ncbi:hypothetical protein TYRP_011559 [Tyrophagus putrescentiae]|nr:hypothetical protein TYRP_011559 [Tyrophagus putrescentiae]
MVNVSAMATPTIIDSSPLPPVWKSTLEFKIMVSVFGLCFLLLLLLALNFAFEALYRPKSSNAKSTNDGDDQQVIQIGVDQNSVQQDYHQQSAESCCHSNLAFQFTRTNSPIFKHYSAVASTSTSTVQQQLPTPSRFIPVVPLSATAVSPLVA